LLFLLGFGYFGDADVEVRVSERGREGVVEEEEEEEEEEEAEEEAEEELGLMVGRLWTAYM